MKKKPGTTWRFIRITGIALFALAIIPISSCNRPSGGKSSSSGNSAEVDSLGESFAAGDPDPVYALLISPETPVPGQPFKILSTGGRSLRKGRIEISGPSGKLKNLGTRTGDGPPFWRIDEFVADGAGKYLIILVERNKEMANLAFDIPEKIAVAQTGGAIWKTTRSWSPAMESLYAAWTNALFYDADERSSWPALHEVMQNHTHNFLFNHLGMQEDDPAAKVHVIMEPDCADNPFYFRAYFAWKLGLPFGYHECDRGYLGKPPQTGRWVTNRTASSRSHPVLAFNAFMRRLMDGVHSGTARTALNDESSDYYPVPLTRNSLRPGTVFADPYGHTLILVKWVPQEGNQPGRLLSVDAQPDGTVAIKRFWKGNFLFTTDEVVGEPGFKAFRPIHWNGSDMKLLTHAEMAEEVGWVPNAMQQKNLAAEEFYQIMDRNINPKPMDPEVALLDLIQALHEQLIARITSVGNGEAYMKVHPGEVIPMPGRPSGVFLAGGSWEDFSTPNRDLRLLIAMDAVLDFPDRIVRTPDDFKLPKLSTPEQVRKNLQEFLDRKVGELSISYVRSDGSEQVLTLKEILARKEAFEMAYNPNDCIEIRWGAAIGSDECSTCRRRVPAGQLEKMKQVRTWFQKRLHPPT